MATVHELMDEIKHLDTEVGIFKVFLVASDHSMGFSAFVDFRAWGQNISSIDAHGVTPEEALTKLRDGLLERFMSREWYMAKVNEADDD